MKKLSTKKLAEMVKSKRDEKKMTQEDLSALTGINRVMIGRMEREDFIPSIHQLEALAGALEFDITDMFVDRQENNSFIALRSEVLSESERTGVDELFTMMLALRQQILLRRRFENEAGDEVR